MRRYAPTEAYGAGEYTFELKDIVALRKRGFTLAEIKKQLDEQARAGAEPRKAKR